jgi:FMN phosphatase YigB (HAD superfamily)
MKINHLIFDLGNTLLDFDLRKASGPISKSLGVPEDRLFEYLFQSDTFMKFESGDIGPDELVCWLNSKFDADITISQFDRLFSPIFTPRPEAISILQRCKGNHELSLLSNTNILHSRYIEATYAFMSVFDHLFYSHALRALKPHPEIFHEVLSRTQSAPEECLFIDDVLQHVEGARKSGIDAIHFQGEALLEKELKSRGVLV